MRSLSKHVWNRYQALLPKTRTIYEPPLPEDLPYQGKIDGGFNYILPDDLLARLKEWLNKRGENLVFYFLTESAGEEPSDFEIETAELTHDNLATVNTNYENALVARDFSWVIFVDHEGYLHVSGPPELMMVLSGN